MANGQSMRNGASQGETPSSFFVACGNCSRGAITVPPEDWRARAPALIRAARSDETDRFRAKASVKCARQASLDTPRLALAYRRRSGGRVVTSPSHPPIPPPRKSIVDPGAHLLRDDIGLLRRAVGGDTERGESAREGRGRGHLGGVRLLRREREASMALPRMVARRKPYSV